MVSLSLPGSSPGAGSVVSSSEGDEELSELVGGVVCELGCSCCICFWYSSHGMMGIGCTVLLVGVGWKSSKRVEPCRYR